jgi:hypothetical protein
MLGAGAGAAVRWLVTITGEPGIATNIKAITAKPTTAKKPRTGIAASLLTGMSAFGGPNRIGGFEELRLAILRQLKPYDAGSIGVAKNLNEWLMPYGEIGSRLNLIENIRRRRLPAFFLMWSR